MSSRAQLSIADIRDERGRPVAPMLVNDDVPGVPTEGDALSVQRLAGGQGHDDTGSGHAREQMTLDVELALDRYQAHACAMFGDVEGAALTLKLCARAPNFVAPAWLVPLFAEHRAELGGIFATRGHASDEAPDHDFYADGEESDEGR